MIVTARVAIPRRHARGTARKSVGPGAVPVAARAPEDVPASARSALGAIRSASEDASRELPATPGLLRDPRRGGRPVTDAGARPAGPAGHVGLRQWPDRPDQGRRVPLSSPLVVGTPVRRVVQEAVATVLRRARRGTPRSWSGTRTADLRDQAAHETQRPGPRAAGHPRLRERPGPPRRPVSTGSGRASSSNGPPAQEQDRDPLPVIHFLTRLGKGETPPLRAPRYGTGRDREVRAENS